MPVQGLSGLTVSSIKKYPAVLPIYALLGIGVALATSATLRTVTKNPEVSVNRRGNPEPWNEYRDKQYKFFGIGRDYTEIKSPAPKF